MRGGWHVNMYRRIGGLILVIFFAVALSGCGGPEKELEDVVSQIETKVDKILDIAQQVENDELGEEDASRYIEKLSEDIVELEKRFNELADKLETELSDEKKAQYGIRVVAALSKLNGI